MSELRTLLRHAGTVLAGQLAVMAFGVTDTIVAGRHSASALAALSIGSAFFVSVYVSLLGVIQALLPEWAELHGAQRPHELGRSVRQALYLCAVTIALGMAALLFPGPLLHWTRVPEALQPEVRRYLAVLAMALPPALLFRLWGTLNQSLGRPQPVTRLAVAALGLKLPLSIWFAFGGLGLDAHGAVGCAWATLVVNYAMLGAALWLLRTQDLYRPYALWRRLERPDGRRLRVFARLGVPAGLALMVEVTSFTLMALFIARQGLVASGGHQVAANLAALLYMTPLSLAIATSARVSFWLGAGQPARAREATGLGVRLAVGLALLAAALLWLGRTPLAALYTSAPAVQAAAVALLPWVALFHLADAVQVMCVFVLRCYRVTVAPLLVYSLLLWGVGLAGGYLLAYRGWGAWPPQGTPVPFWACSALALALVALIFGAMLWRVRPPRRPAA